jgi:hypothetical protein
MRASLLTILVWTLLLGVGCKSDSDDGDGNGGGDGDGDAPRGEGVPETWNEYCGAIGEAYCQREEACGDGFETCMTFFMVGCCEAENACASSFGAGITTEELDACIDDTNEAECGARAPESCQELSEQSPSMPSDGPRSLLSACAGSCLAQEATGCSGVLPATTCINSCLELPERLTECEDAWIELNTCMAGAPLFCDTVNGGAAVSSDDCGPEIEAFTSC